LLATLWLVALLGVLVGVSLRLAEIGAATSRNRVTLTRAGWAREACGEILLSRYALDRSTRLVDTVDLGRGTWCQAELEDAGARLDLNRARPDALRILFANDTLADALLDWRDADDVPRRFGAEADWYRAAQRRLPRNGPLGDVTELRWIRGFEDSAIAGLAPVLTTRGKGRISLASAPTRLLATLPGFGADALEMVSRRRLTGEPVKSIDHLAGLLSPPAREMLMAQYQALGDLVASEPEAFIAVIEGGIRGAPPVARATLMLTPHVGGLAVTRREVE
jgi:hypothetical protein